MEVISQWKVIRQLLSELPAGDDFTPLNRKEIRLKNAISGSSFDFLCPSLFSIDEHRMVLQI